MTGKEERAAIGETLHAWYRPADDGLLDALVATVDRIAAARSQQRVVEELEALARNWTDYRMASAQLADRAAALRASS